MNFKISPHFTYNELTHTNHSQYLAQNRHNGTKYIKPLRLLCNYVLEPLRAIVGKHIIVTSCFRRLSLNTHIGGSFNSQHLYGEALDFYVKDFDIKKAFGICQLKLKYGQLILYDKFLHISSACLEENGQVFTCEIVNNIKIYTRIK